MCKTRLCRSVIHHAVTFVRVVFELEVEGTMAQPQKKRIILFPITTLLDGAQCQEGDTAMALPDQLP